MNLKPYTDYKDSHQKWLGNVPSHWEVRPSKSVFDLRNEPEKQGDVHLTPSQTLGVLPQSEYMRITGNKVVLALAGTTMKHVEVNDFVIHLRSFQGGIEWSGYQGKVSPAYTLLKPKDCVVPRFFQYCLKSRGYIETIASLTDQLRDGQSMRYYDFGKTPLPLPPLNEQREIAAFLDRETSEIDAFIADQEELITLLSERRTAMITRAVTKGLDPNAPIEDSGVEWLGEIPSLWTIQKATWIGRVFSSEPIGGNEITENSTGVPFLKVSSLSPDNFELSEPIWFVTPSREPAQDFIVFPKRGAAIFGNKVNIVEGAAIMDPNLMGWKLTSGHSNLYFSYVLKSLRLEEIADVSTVPQINTKHMASLLLPVPSANEQEEIGAYLNRETAEIDAAIADAREAIALSKERRAAVISAAVTGKIDVRGLLDPATSIVEGASVGAA